MAAELGGVGGGKLGVGATAFTVGESSPPWGESCRGEEESVPTGREMFGTCVAGRGEGDSGNFFLGEVRLVTFWVSCAVRVGVEVAVDSFCTRGDGGSATETEASCC